MRKKTILLVEDEVLIAMEEQMVLEKHGYRVIAVTSGRNAIEAVQTNPAVDLILMDIDLGSDMDGTEAAAMILREHDLPVVFLSSHTEPAIVEKTEKMTSYGYIVKNSGDTVLLASIKMAFRLFEARMRQQETEKALRESENKHRYVVENAVEAICVIQEDHFRFFNPEACRLFGYSAAEMAQINPDRTIHPDDRELVVATRRKRLAGENVKRVTSHRITTREKVMRWVELRAVVIQWSGKPALLVFLTDCTDRKQVEEALEKERWRLTGILEGTNVGTWEWNVQTGENIFNERWAEIIGYTLAELSPVSIETWQQFAHPDDLKTSAELLDKVFRREADYYDCEVRMRHKSGHWVWIQDRGKVITWTAEGKPLLMAGTHQDITRRKQMEERLRESEEKFRFLTENMSDVVWTTDMNLNTTYISPSCVNAVGFTAEERVNQTIEQMIVPDSLEKVKQQFQQELVRERHGTADPHRTAKLEAEYYHKNDSTVWMEMMVSALRNDRGEITGLYGVSRNITERKRAEAFMQRQLQEKETLLRETHHRIKNNIASIYSLLSIQAHATTSPESRKVLNQAIGRVYSMGQLYEKMLIEDDFRDVPTASYLGDLTDSIVALFTEEATVAVEKNLSDFLLDPKKMFPLGIILNELLTNALKYAFVDREPGRITVSLAREGDLARLTVRDDGRGLPEGFTIESSDRFGLKLTRMLVEQLDGSFGMENCGGTVCRLEFPL